jgi:hypothetical protein
MAPQAVWQIHQPRAANFQGFRSLPSPNRITAKERKVLETLTLLQK